MAAGVVVVAIVFVLLLWKVPEWQTPSGITDLTERAQLQNELRRTIAQIALGLLVLGTLFVGWRRVRAADRTVEIASEQQITERFTRAIEQLGSDKMAIRLGGIYALERIARDSPKDHWQVMEVLTAYARENARWQGERDEDGVPVSDASEEHHVPTDIQAILTVLGRRNTESELESQHLYLNGTDLRRADLANADLLGAELFRVSLQGAYLWKANLQDALFFDSNLQGAFIEEANLQGARLYIVNLQGTNLRKANLQGARNLTQEQLDSAFTNQYTVLPDYLKQDQAEG